MQHINSFAEVLEADDKLPLEDQEALIEILSRRVADCRRAEMIKNIEEARKEFREGRCKVGTPDEIMKEILS